MLSGPELRNAVARDMERADIFADHAYTFQEAITAVPRGVLTPLGTIVTVPPEPAGTPTPQGKAGRKVTVASGGRGPRQGGQGAAPGRGYAGETA